MPYLDKDKKREYQREWLQTRRNEWFAANGPCCLCGSSEKLELDHIDKYEKVSHKVWSWSESKRNAELSKCRVLCFHCHQIKHGAYRGWYSINRPPMSQIQSQPLDGHERENRRALRK